MLNKIRHICLTSSVIIYMYMYIQSADSEINFRVVQGISVIAGVGPRQFFLGKLKKSFKNLNFRPLERWVGVG